MSRLTEEERNARFVQFIMDNLAAPIHCANDVYDGLSKACDEAGLTHLKARLRQCELLKPGTMIALDQSSVDLNTIPLSAALSAPKE